VDDRLTETIRQGMREGRFRTGDAERDAMPHKEEDLVAWAHDFIVRAPAGAWTPPNPVPVGIPPSKRIRCSRSGPDRDNGLPFVTKETQ
jgi:hypothetical protein